MKVLTILVLSVSLTLAQPTVNYAVSFDNVSHYEANVSATFSGVMLRPLELRMSRTSPGRYALHEFAKNVYAVQASDGTGTPLHVVQANPHQWNIPEHDGIVRVTYTVFGDRADGTYAGFDETHAHMNIPATFMWARGYEDASITVSFLVPDGSGWKVGTQLVPTDDEYTFTAPNFQYFMDSPAELSNHALRTWMVTEGERTFTYRLVLHHEGTDAEADVYAEMANRLVEEARGVFGEFPAFDYGTYTFLADYLPWVYGDGMEHRNSTVLSSSSSLRKSASGQASTLIHEAFHAWNVERIRPSSLEPFNFEEANMSAELWFAEGVTSYYDNLLMHRAGLKTIDAFAAGLGSALDAVVNAPGRRFYGPAEMSMKAPFNDAATSVDAQNTRNTFISYYTWGEALGIGLDLTLRTMFPGKDLDGFMRTVWARHGKPEVPYSNHDLLDALGAYTGDPSFAEEFFGRYVFGRDVVNYGELLEKAGFLLRLRESGTAGFGRVRLDFQSGKAVVATQTLIGSPLYGAGIDRWDVIVSIDGTVLRSQEEYAEILDRHRPGEEVAVVFESRGTTETANVILEENDELEVVPFEAAGRALSPTMTDLRESWLGSRSLIEFTALTKTCRDCKRTFEFGMRFCSYDGEELPFADGD